MIVTKEAVQKRLEQLETERKKLDAEVSKLAANVCAYNGAIEDCLHWLAVLNKEGADFKLLKETAELGKVDADAKAN